MSLIFLNLILFFSQNTFADVTWMEIRASSLVERTQLASEGYDIVAVEKDRVIVLGDTGLLQRAEANKTLLARYAINMSPFDFPQGDEPFHSYQETVEELQSLQKQYSSVMSLFSIGTSFENRDLWMVRLSGDATVKPATVFMGGHHAREHIAVEVPLKLVRYLLEEYQKKNPRIVSIFNNYEVFVLPIVNPDGKQFDVASGNYQHWRKNRSKNSGTSYGVDINRNYGYGWGGAGASTSPSNETYRGPSAFSELETQAIKRWIEQTPQVSMLLSYHSFSQLVMWPWGHIEDKIPDPQDLAKFETMGKKMAAMTGYTPMKSGDLYLASGDTCDWAYGEHGIFAFTFELDPKDFWQGGFYPGAKVIESVFQKNIEPALYMIESAMLK